MPTTPIPPLVLTDIAVFLHRSSSTPSTSRMLARAFIVVNAAIKITDLRIIQGTDREGNGNRLILAFPDKPTVDFCPECDAKNPVQQPFCGYCGTELPGVEIKRDENGREDRRGMYADIAHPVSAEARKMIEEAVFQEYWEEVGRKERIERLNREWEREQREKWRARRAAV